MSLQPASGRVLVVSDTHLSPRAPTAEENWSAVVDYAARVEVDLVVHAGDLTLDGIGDPSELEYARRQLDRLSAPCLTVPGNHDVGDTPGPPSLDTGRLDAWRERIGPDRWVAQVDRWTLIGLNAQLFDSASLAEEEQWDWFVDQVRAQPEDRPIALVIHKPISAPAGEVAAAPTSRFVGERGRRNIAEQLDHRWCPLVVSGHVHQHRIIDDRRRRHVWAPTTWAVLPERSQRTVGRKQCGVVSISLGGDGSAETALVTPPRLNQLTIGAECPDPYLPTSP